MPNSLATEHDIDELLEGSLLLRRLAATPALADVIEAELEPGCAVQSREQLIDDIRRRASTRVPPGQHLPHGARCAASTSSTLA